MTLQGFLMENPGSFGWGDSGMDQMGFELQSWLAANAGVIERVGGEAFPGALLDAIYQAVAVDSAFILAHRTGHAPQLLERGRVLEGRWQEVSRYLAGPYLLDPVHLACTAGREGLVQLRRIAPDDFAESEYFRSFYASHGLTDEANFLVPLGAGEGIAISLGRVGVAPGFTPAELDALRAIEPLVRAMARRHWGQPDWPVAPRGADLEGIVRRIGQGSLTERESEVARLILRGHSSKSIARELEITPETVRVHRKNIHTKLGIGSQGELFSLFLDAIGCDAPGSTSI